MKFYVLNFFFKFVIFLLLNIGFFIHDIYAVALIKMSMIPEKQHLTRPFVTLSATLRDINIHIYFKSIFNLYVSGFHLL